jgi:hypothetical protein
MSVRENETLIRILEKAFFEMIYERKSASNLKLSLSEYNELL